MSSLITSPILGPTGPVIGDRAAAPVVPLFLDDYPGAVAAFALQKLRAAQTLACKIRRSPDDLLKDIGFDGENFDISAAESFCGAGDGYIDTFYDQSGNGHDYTKSTHANQPQIVSSGSVITENGLPAADFDGVNTFMSRSGITTGYYLGAGYENTMLAVIMQDTSASKNNVFEVIGDGVELVALVAAWDNDNIFYDTGDKTGSQRRVFTSIPAGWDGAQHIVACQSDGVDAEIRVDGVSEHTEAVSGSPATDTSTTATIGSDGPETLGGKFQAFINYADADNSLTAMESDLNGIYSTF